MRGLDSKFGGGSTPIVNPRPALPSFVPQPQEKLPEHSLYPAGRPLPKDVRDKILCELRVGHIPISDIARKYGTTYGTVSRMLNKDPELKEAFADAWNAKMDEVEMSMVDLAINCENSIAREKAGEYVLRYNRKQKYSDDVVSTDKIASLPKIVVALNIPVRNAEPPAVENEKKPASEEVVDV